MILPQSETINTTPVFVGENREGWRLRDGGSVENNKWGFFTKAVKSRRGWESRQKNWLFQMGFSLETGFRDMRRQSREPLAQLSTAKRSLVGTPFTALHWNPTLHSTLRIKFSKATLIFCYTMPTRRYCYNLWLRTHSRKWKHSCTCCCCCCYSVSWITSRFGFTWEEVGRDDQSGYSQQKKTGHPATDSGGRLPNNLTTAPVSECTISTYFHCQQNATG